MPAGTQFVQRTIDHVGNRSQRMVIIGMNIRKSPGNIFKAQARSDIRVIVNIRIIVKIYKTVMEDWFIRNESDNRKSDID
jgi:hypothetical protein